MHEKTLAYKGFTVKLAIPEAGATGGTHGSVQISGPETSIGVRFTPDWMQAPKTTEEAEAWLFAYAAGAIDCELAGGFGMDLGHE
ncbi:hypothetical protein [Cupriavidus basilensis]|uniref:hypothetical protein n=1 Tax=Cupriavidus basilensis TaxID=68895 RepID=UPI0005B9E6D7|nr:hypothetical protein [Cupriavidus basilensis]